MQFTKLFEPLETPKITLKNRLVVPPMETTLGGEDGSITPELIAYWEERAKGGFGTLILENSSVDPAGNVCLHTPGFYSEEQVPNLSRAADVVSSADILLIIGTSMQVYPAAGLYQYAPSGCRIFMVDPDESAAAHVSGVVHIKDVATAGMRRFREMVKDL